MAATTNTVVESAVATQFALQAARDAYAALRRAKGERPQAVLAFLQAETDEAREDAVAEWGAGFVRRGLREAAVFFEAKDDQETANAFWLLRDDIDDDGYASLDETDTDVTE